MMSLFSSFDLFLFHKYYFTFLGGLYLLNFGFWKNLNYYSNFLKISKLMSFFSSLKPKFLTKFYLNLIVSIFLFLGMLNLFSLFPFIFPTTSSFGMIMGLALTLWVGMILFFTLNSTSIFLSHLIPDGSPLSLSFFLFMVEMVSSVIRPITLTVRLVANILAGHLIMILLYKLVMIFPLTFLCFMVLNIVEIFVSIIQSYIFCTMLMLYFSEIY